MATDWYTPTDIIEAARRTMGGIDLDPASDEEANRTVKATRFFSTADDGLLQPWEGRLWLNPPFGALDTRKFVGKLVACFDEGIVEQACILIPYTPDNRTVATLFGRFPHCHFREKPVFTRPFPLTRSAIQFPVVLFCLGSDEQKFAAEFSALGAICSPQAQYRSLTGSLF